MSWSEILRYTGVVLNTKLFAVGSTQVTVATALTSLSIMLLTVWLSRVVRSSVERRMQRRTAGEGAISVLSSLLHYAILVIGFGIALQTAGINLTALFAAGAIFAVGLGFAMQNIAQNFVSGVILLAERSIKPGDIVEADGRVVRVMSMGIRATIVQARDGETLILPNSSLVQASVTNFTLAGWYRLRLMVGVVYSADMKRVFEALRRVADEVTDRNCPHAPDVFMTEFGNNSVNFEVAVWMVDPWRLRSAQSRLAQAIWWALAEEKITIAFPQLDLHLDPEVVDSLRGLGAARAS